MGKFIFGGKGAVGAPYRVASHSGLHLSGSRAPHARGLGYGNMQGGLVSREFDAIYVELDAVLEPALTLVNGRWKNGVGFREKIALKVNSLSIEKSAYMGMWSEIRAGSLWSARRMRVSG